MLASYLGATWGSSHLIEAAYSDSFGLYVGGLVFERYGLIRFYRGFVYLIQQVIRLQRQSPGLVCRLY